MTIRKIQQTQNSVSYPAASIVKKDPKMAAMISKGVRDNRMLISHDEKGNRRTVVTNSYAMKNSLQRRAKRNADARTILKLLPDIELSIQILVSSILSPSDMMSNELNYTGPKDFFSSNLQATLLNTVKNYFDDIYKIRPLLSKMLRDILAEKGSYPVAVLPENAIDEFINRNFDHRISFESLSKFIDKSGKPKNIGILGNNKQNSPTRPIGFSMESFNVPDKDKIDNRVHYSENSIEEYLFVTDNPITLKIPKLNDRIRTTKIKKTMNSALESFSIDSMQNNVNDSQIEKLIFADRKYKQEQVGTLKKQDELARKSIGEPLVMKLPSESVIPVHVPGNVEEHVGYFIILDEEGNPIEAPDDEYFYSSIGNEMTRASGNSLASSIIRKIDTNIGGGTFDPSNSGHLDYAAKIYADMIERDLIARVKNGIHSSSVAIAKNEEVYRIMFSRVLAKKYTQLLYLPKEYITYMAFKYGDDGIGKSLLDETSMINTLRTVLLFTDVIASIKNSIGRTAVTMTIPENDPNPLRTIEIAQDEIVKSRQLGIPLGVTNPTDITDFIQRAGFEWKFEGHPGLPDLKFDIQATNMNYTKPDTDLQDFLRKSSIMAMGLSPEMVDSGFNTEFATSVVANNVLLGKRVLQYQELFAPQLSDHLRKIASHTESLILDLKNILKENLDGIKITDEQLLEEFNVSLTGEAREKVIISKALKYFLETFEVVLPKPPSVTLNNQLDDLKVYLDALDTAIDAYISDSFMNTTTSGDLSNEVNTIKAMVKSHFTRKYMSDNGMLTELSDLTAVRDDGEPQLNFMKEITEHVKALVRSGVTTLVKLAPIAKAATDDLAATGAGENDSGSDYSDSSSDNSSDDEFGSMDFGDDSQNEDSAENTDEEKADSEKEESDKEEEDKEQTDEDNKDDDKDEEKK